MDGRFATIRDESLRYLSAKAEYDTKDPFFTSDLGIALAEPRVEALLVDALTHFGAAEVALRAIAKEGLQRL